MASVGLTLTPNTGVNAYPCLKCLSKTELLAMLATVLYALNHTGDHTLVDMVEDGACFKCLSDHQHLEAIVGFFTSLAIANQYFDSAEDLKEASQCLNCTEPAVVKGIITKAVGNHVTADWPQLN